MVRVGSLFHHFKQYFSIFNITNLVISDGNLVLLASALVSSRHEPTPPISDQHTPPRTYRALCLDPEQGLGVDIEHLRPALPSTSAEQPTVPPPPPTEGHVLELGDALVQKMFW